jgi:hypothetical protein
MSTNIQPNNMAAANEVMSTSIPAYSKNITKIINQIDNIWESKEPKKIFHPYFLSFAKMLTDTGKNMYKTLTKVPRSGACDKLDL